jgi:hypothetical protein
VEPTVGELVSKISQEASTLVRDELRLAQVELSRKAKYAGLGAGLVGASGIVAGLGLACLVAAAVLGLALAVPAWLSALLVGLALFVTAGIAALMGKREISEALPPVPEEAIGELKADLKVLKR